MNMNKFEEWVIMPLVENDESRLSLRELAAAFDPSYGKQAENPIRRGRGDGTQTNLKKAALKMFPRSRPLETVAKRGQRPGRGIAGLAFRINPASAEEIELFKQKRHSDNILRCEQALSAAYVRIREKLSAFDVPFAPTPEQIWSHTEARLDQVLRERSEAIAAVADAMEYIPTTLQPRFRAVLKLNESHA